MREDFLHYLWRYKKFNTDNLETTLGEELVINSVGQYNTNSGPDFFNAQIKIDNQLWAGNVEVHVKSSDWFLHNHEKDNAYDNVILHVVWEDDIAVYRKNNSAIPALELKNLVEKKAINKYEKLFSKQGKWINCENDFGKTDEFFVNNWLERLYLERLQRKTSDIEKLLAVSKNDWEAVLFIMLAKNFGLKVNGDSFLSLARSIDFSIIRKVQSNQHQLEALFLGQAGLLEKDFENGYYLSLKREYKFLKQKFKIDNNNILPIKFFRLRPLNFPTIRLSQLSQLYYEHSNLFSKVMETNKLGDFYKLFKISTSGFWKTHYTFQKESKLTNKTLSKGFVDLLLINTVLPIKFSYARQKGENINDLIIEIANTIVSEKNNIVTAFNNLKEVSKSSLHSQALIQLKTEYCDKNKCLQCAIGNSIFK